MTTTATETKTFAPNVPPSADLLAKWPLAIGDLQHPTRIENVLFISDCGLTGSGNHAYFTARVDGQQDNPHRIQVLLDPKFAPSLRKGMRFVNPTLAKAQKPVTGSDPARPTFESIEPNMKARGKDKPSDPDVMLVYWTAYMIDCDQVVVSNPAPLEAIGAKIDQALAAIEAQPTQL